MASQVVLISGCSSGFGLLAAVRAAKAGHRVYATMRDLNKRASLDRAAADAGVKIEVRQLDVDSAESIQQCVDGILREAGRIDALINNAGFGMGGTVFDLTMDELRAQFETNVFGLVDLTNRVVPSMKAHGRGDIVNIASTSGMKGAATATPYAARAIMCPPRKRLTAGRALRPLIPGCDGWTRSGAARPAQVYRAIRHRRACQERLLTERSHEPHRVVKTCPRRLGHASTVSNDA